MHQFSTQDAFLLRTDIGRDRLSGERIGNQYDAFGAAAQAFPAVDQFLDC